MNREQGIDDMAEIKVEMPKAQLGAFLESTPLSVDRLEPGELGRLGSDHGAWDLHGARNLRTGQARLPDARVLNVGVADGQGEAVVVYVVNHGT